ncbi:MAG: sn-glycerol-3-phosphate ABC transporter ATP-binding protein UgpC [Candidatus Sumerlaeia bacterium]|nr:sn-glycerol-3-phosphate ABC transporter ATP-binding protein UgpC [Candidatus Sumerlaeia bacterium]
MADVVLCNVTKVYPPGVVAVKDLSLEVRDREFMVLVGPSGCGKSTTLRMIAGLEPVTSGEIFIADRQVNDVAPKDRDLAMVFQNYALYPHMSVYRNMAFGLQLRGGSRAEIDRRVREAADILGITHLLDRKPRALSGGERQRVAVGRAIVRQPQAFLFDEPLSNLDAKMRVQMRAELSKLHGRLAATMIYVTHDQVEAMTMGDRIAVMKDGVIQQVAEPLELYEHPANRFVAEFIGSPPMNFIEGHLESVGGGFFFTDGRFRVEMPLACRDRVAPHTGKRVTFGIRPEHLCEPVMGVDVAGPLAPVTARVELIEPMGAEQFMYLSLNDTTLIARLDSHIRAEVNEIRTLYMEMSQAHLFDATTGQAIF